MLFAQKDRVRHLEFMGKMNNVSISQVNSIKRK